MSLMFIGLTDELSEFDVYWLSEEFLESRQDLGTRSEFIRSACLRYIRNPEQQVYMPAAWIVLLS